MGGAKRHLDNMVEELSRLTSENIYYVVLNETYAKKWEAANVKTITFPIAYSNGVKRLWFDNIEINRLIENYKIDLLISFANFGPYRAKCNHILFETNALYFCDNIRKIYSKKTQFISDIRKFLIKLSGIHADIIVTPSHSLKDQLIQSLGFTENRISVLYHAIDKDTLGKPTTLEKSDSSTVRFIVTSHLTRHKRIETLIDAILLLKSHGSLEKTFHIQCTFDRRDNNQYFDELMKRIESEQLNEYISFIGRIEQNEIANLYATADCMLHTTACESFGFSLLEAKLFHLPIICSDIPINREIAKNSALYFETDNARELADRMKYFIEKRPNDFNFDDELIDWNWKKYSEKLLHLAERIAND